MGHLLPYGASSFDRHQISDTAQLGRSPGKASHLRQGRPPICPGRIKKESGVVKRSRWNFKNCCIKVLVLQPIIVNWLWCCYSSAPERSSQRELYRSHQMWGESTHRHRHPEKMSDIQGLKCHRAHWGSAPTPLLRVPKFILKIKFISIKGPPLHFSCTIWAPATTFFTLNTADIPSISRQLSRI